MAVLSRGQTYGSTETITNTKLHNLVDLGSVTAIMDADIDNSANISDTKLGDITTGNKVSGSAFYNLASTPAGAGVFPYTNIPSASLVSIPNVSLIPINLASWVSGYSFKELASTPSNAGQFPQYSMVSSLASGGLPVFDGVRNFVGKNPTQLFQNLSNVVFEWHGNSSNAGTDVGHCSSTTIAGSVSGQFVSMRNVTQIFVTVLIGKFKKISGINTLTVYAQISNPAGNTTSCKVDVGGQNVTLTTTSTSPAWVSGDIDVSGLSNGTVYDIAVQLKDSSDTMSALYHIELIAS